MAATLIHEASSLKFTLNTGTASEPKKSTVSIAQIKDEATAPALAPVATAVDALFDYDVQGHKLSKTYQLDLG